MSDQKAMNVQTWDALLTSGFTPGTVLGIDVFFVAPDGPEATAVADALAGSGWNGHAFSERRGLLRNRTEWGAVGHRAVVVSSLADLDVMVDEMDALAARAGASFDGWGAEVGE